MAEATTVKIGEHELKLVAPESMAIRWEILGLAGINHQRACWAALGACAKGKGRPKTLYEACGYSPAIYGQRVADELLKRPGVTFNQVYGAGLTALSYLQGTVIPAEEAAATEDFTAPPEDASTS